MKHKFIKRLIFHLLFFLIINLTSNSQASYKNIVLESDRIRGFVYIGAYEVLDSLHILESIEHVGGSSASGIQAVLLAVGYTPAEMRLINEKIPLKKFNDGGWSIIGRTKRLHKQFGGYKGDGFANWIGELIAKKTDLATTTFIELHARRTERGFKDLHVTGTDLTYQCLRIFSYEQYPNMSVRDAVRISISIPLYYRPVLIDDSGLIYAKTEQNKIVHVMVDGRVLSNYPIHMFGSTKYSTTFDSINTFYSNTETQFTKFGSCASIY